MDLRNGATSASENTTESSADDSSQLRHSQFNMRAAYSESWRIEFGFSVLQVATEPAFQVCRAFRPTVQPQARNHRPEPCVDPVALHRHNAKYHNAAAAEHHGHHRLVRQLAPRLSRRARIQTFSLSPVLVFPAPVPSAICSVATFSKSSSEDQPQTRWLDAFRKCERLALTVDLRLAYHSPAKDVHAMQMTGGVAGGVSHFTPNQTIPDGGITPQSTS